MATITKRERNANKPWAVRWRDDTGHQREAAFKLKAEATAFKIKLEHDQREGTFVDPRQATETFSEAAEAWLERLPVTPGTKRAYGSTLRNHVTPAIGDRQLRHLAQDRNAVADLVNVTMLNRSRQRREIARLIITGTLDEAVNAGRLPRHRCSGIRLAAGVHSPDRDDFIFPSHSQLEAVAAWLGESTLGENLESTVWLMRGCGLRISEALAVRKEGFRDEGTVLRIHEQVTPDGYVTMPMKHRKTGDSREIPVPSYLWDMVKDLPDGYLFRRDSGRFPIQRSYWQAFTAARTAAGIPDGFTPHSLRHAFASALLARNVPIHDVAKWLGHRSIDVTYKIYGHLVPSAWGRAREALEAEYEDWSSETL
jgi:integrase